jgi:hypothetical protein
MNKHEATRLASLAKGKALILEGQFEILDTVVTFEFRPGTPEFEVGCKALEILEAKLEAAQGEATMLWGLALDDIEEPGEEYTEQDAARDFGAEPKD